LRSQILTHLGHQALGFCVVTTRFIFLHRLLAASAHEEYEKGECCEEQEKRHENLLLAAL